MRDFKNRLQRVSAIILALPVSPAATRRAFKRFEESGELPEDCRLAYAVTKRAKQGHLMAELYDITTDWGTLIQARLDEPTRPADSIMDGLYSEAVFAIEPIRRIARLALKHLATCGIDVTRPVFAENGLEPHLSDYGSVGMHVMGYPRILAKKPYKQQAVRLLARIDDLRARIPQDDPTWSAQLEDAVDRFQHAGEVPEDERMLDPILVLGELTELTNHAAGRGDPEILAAFDTAARASGQERGPAIETLREMARDGRFGGRTE